jgi:hypothetical protein
MHASPHWLVLDLSIKSPQPTTGCLGPHTTQHKQTRPSFLCNNPASTAAVPTTSLADQAAQQQVHSCRCLYTINVSNLLHNSSRVTAIANLPWCTDLPLPPHTVSHSAVVHLARISAPTKPMHRCHAQQISTPSTAWRCCCCTHSARCTSCRICAPHCAHSAEQHRHCSAVCTASNLHILRRLQHSAQHRSQCAPLPQRLHTLHVAHRSLPPVAAVAAPTA